MRKNQLLNKTLSVAVAAAMAFGAALPVYAAEGGVKKEETVYVVLNADGSIKSQTVSDHLHSDSGLAGVTDATNLQNIQNTQSAAAFTQNGTALTWDTDDTDVYYKGDTTATPPVTATINYTLDGNHLTAEQLAGQSGHLVISIALANNTMAQATVNGSARSVCTPFAALVGTMLAEDTFKNVTADHGIVQSDGGSTIVGIATLPGIKACLGDLIPAKLNKLTDYMLDTVTIETDVTDCTIPNIMVACAADASLLKDDDGDSLLGDLDDLDGMQEDLDKLTDAMDQLLDGAKQLNDGAGDLQSGAKQLADGTGTLYTGVNTLKAGTASLLSGANELNSGAGTLTAGTTKLQSGASTLAGGANDLKDGADKLAGGASKANDGAAALAAGTQAAASGAKDLATGAGKVNAGAQSLANGAADLKTGAGSLQAGLQTLSAGLNKLTGSSATLRDGAQAVADGVLLLANKQVQAADPGITLTRDNYAAVLGELSGVTEAQCAQAKASIAAQSGLADTQLDALICLANGNLTATAPTSADITAAVTEAGKTMQAAQAAAPKIAAAQQALTDAAGDPLAIPAVKGVVDGIIMAQLQAAPADAFEAAPENVENTATPEQAQEEVAAETTDSGITPEMEQAVYSQLAAAITVEDDATKALLITMACQAVATGAETDVPTAIGNAAAAATVANTVNTVLTEVAAGNKAADIDAFLKVSVATTEAPLLNLLRGAFALADGVNAYTVGVDTAALGAVSAYNGSATLAAGAQTLATGATELATGTKELLAGTGTLTEGAQKLNDGAQSLATGTKELTGGANTLADGSKTLASGAATLSGGVNELATGANTLKNGTATLTDGAQKLDDGAADLQSGAKKLDDGAQELYSGTNDLKDGTQDLLDGVNKLNDEGISKLTDSLDLDSIETLKDVASEMKDRQDAYTGYSAAPENGTASVKFVMKTAESTAPANSVDADAVSAVTDATPAKTSLWQRIVNLFHFGK